MAYMFYVMLGVLPGILIGYALCAYDDDCFRH